MSKLSSPHIAIVGGGIIGLSCAWAMARRGAKVTVFDAGRVETGASWAAAGMLAPAYEGLEDGAGHAGLAELCRKSADLWGQFARDLEREGGTSIGYFSGPSIAVATTKDGLAKIAVMGEPIGGSQLVSLEPSLRGEIEGGVLLPADGWVDNRRVLRVLRAVLIECGAEFVARHIAFGDRVLDGLDAVLFANGTGSPVPVIPLKGVMLAFDRKDVPIERVIRCGSEYAVPRGERTLIGATVGEVENPETYLATKASTFLQGIEAATPVESWIGYRPTTPDHAPYLGALKGERRYIAAGHYRNGILLAPLTAQLMADMILEGETPEMVEAFAPDRFTVTT